MRSRGVRLPNADSISARWSSSADSDLGDARPPVVMIADDSLRFPPVLAFVIMDWREGGTGAAGRAAVRQSPPFRRPSRSTAQAGPENGAEEAAGQRAERPDAVVHRLEGTSHPGPELVRYHRGGFHFVNPNISGGFDVTKPPILVYEHTGGKWQFGALEWVFTSIPKNPPLPNATFGFFPAACHYVDGAFVPEPSQADCPTTAPGTGAAFFFWHPKLYAMHFWIWYPNPAGLYSGMNPLVAPFNGG